jgi:hypothetical protein
MILLIYQEEVHRVRIKPLDDYSESFSQLVRSMFWRRGITSRSGIGIVSRSSILCSIHNDSVNHSWNFIAIEEEKAVPNWNLFCRAKFGTSQKVQKLSTGHATLQRPCRLFGP